MTGVEPAITFCPKEVTTPHGSHLYIIKNPLAKAKGLIKCKMTTTYIIYTTPLAAVING